MAVSYVTRHHRAISRIMPGGTPYNHALLNDAVDNLSLDRTIGNPTQMRAIRDGWNNENSSDRPRMG